MRVVKQLQEATGSNVNALMGFLLEHSSEGYLAFDLQCRYTIWNSRMEYISGMKAAQVLNRVAFEVFPFLLETGECSFFYDALAGKTVRAGRRVFTIPATGRAGYFEAIYSPSRNESGQITGGMAIIRDVTFEVEREQADRRLETEHAVARVLSDVLTIEEAANGLLAPLCNLLPAQIAEIWLLDKAAGNLFCAAIYTPEKGETYYRDYRTVSRTLRLDRGVGLPGKIWALEKFIAVEDLTEDPNFPRKQIASVCGLKGAFGVPIASGATFFGVLQFCTAQPMVPDPSLVKMMMALGQDVAQFIRRRRAEAEVKRLNQALVRRVSELETLLQVMPVGVAISSDPECEKVSSNPALGEMLGGKAEGENAILAGDGLKWPSKVLHEGKPLPVTEMPLHKAARTGKRPAPLECEIRFPDGSHKHILVTAAPLFDETRKVRGAIAVHIDISRQKTIEENLRRRERELADFVENATEGLHWVGPKGDIIWANKAELKMLGYTADEYIGRHIADFHVDHTVIAKILCHLGNNQELSNFEARLRAKDGSIRHVLIDSSAYRENGKFVHTRCFTRDITARKKAEERSQTLSQLGHKLNSVTTARDAASIIVRAAEQLIGWDACSFDLCSPTLDTIYPILNIDLIDDAKQEISFGQGKISPSALVQEVLAGRSELILRQTPLDFSDKLTPFGSKRPSASLMFVPVRNKKKTVGVLSIQSYKENAYDGVALETLQSLADYCGGALDRISMEETLHASEERFRALFEQSPLAIQIFNPSGKLLRANNALADFWNNKREDVMRYNILEDSQFEAVGALPLIKRAFAGESVTFGPVPYDTIGATRWVEAFLYSIKDENGCARELVLLLEDVSARIKTEQALREKEEQARYLAAVVQSSDDAIISKDLDGRITNWNKAAEQLYGFSAEEMLGQRITRLLPPEHAGEELGFLDQIRSGEGFAHLETVRLTKTGERIDVSLTISPIKGADSRIVGASIIGRNITQKKRAELVLRESESRFRELAEAIPHIVWTANSEGVLEYCNDRWKLYTGVDHKGDRMGTWASVIHPDFAADVIERWNDFVAKGELHELEYPLRGADGSFRWHLDRAVPLKNGEGRITKWFGTCTDIHEKKEAAEMVLRLNVELERRVQERTSALSEINEQMESFCYSVSHDLRAPVRAMRAFTQILIDDHNSYLDDAAKDYLCRIASAAERMDRLIQDLLQYSRIGRMEISLAPVDIDRAIEGVLADLRLEIKQKQATVEVRKPLPVLHANETLLDQVLVNLVGNALKFVAPDVRPLIEISAEVDGNLAKVFVKDNGIGIAPEYHKRIFEIFERLHGAEMYAGTGIGLAIVQKSVIRMHGKVGVTSEPGKGTCFWFELPVTT